MKFFGKSLDGWCVCGVCFNGIVLIPWLFMDAAPGVVGFLRFLRKKGRHSVHHTPAKRNTKKVLIDWNDERNDVAFVIETASFYA